MKNIRYYAFWTFDYLRGSPIRKYYNEIRRIFYEEKGAKELQEKLLSNLLVYAVTHSEFYKTYDPTNLKDFPITNKSVVISNMDAMFSSEYKQKKDTLKTMSTSGSTGTPFKIYQCPNKELRNKADLLFFYKIGGYNPGDRLYYMRIWTEMNKRSKKRLVEENFRMFNTSNLDKAGASKFIKTMTSDKSQKVLLGFPSSFAALMENIDTDRNFNWNIKTILTQAEELPNQTKKRMQKIFNCPVVAIYSNQENGILGQQPVTGENYFELNTGSYFLEFLKLHSNEPAQEMEEARIVVTDLFNRAVPLIRYDTEDIGMYSYYTDERGNKRKVLNKIVGRKADYLYSNEGERLSPYILITMMWKHKGIRQCQIIQEDLDKVTLKVVYRDNSLKMKIEKELSKELKEVFGTDTKITFNNVEHIPREASGKRRYIVSKIDDNVQTLL